MGGQMALGNASGLLMATGVKMHQPKSLRKPWTQSRPVNDVPEVMVFNDTAKDICHNFRKSNRTEERSPVQLVCHLLLSNGPNGSALELAAIKLDQTLKSPVLHGRFSLSCWLRFKGLVTFSVARLLCCRGSYWGRLSRTWMKLRPLLTQPLLFSSKNPLQVK